jgi:hypothetical protein
MDTTRSKSWAELLEEEENMEEPNFQEIFVPVEHNIASKVKTETTGRTEVMKVSVNDKTVSNVKESEADVNVKEELEDQEDEEARLQKELDIFEHEWVRELKQEQLNENQTRETTATYVSSVLKQKNDETKETCDIASDKDDIPTKARSPKVKVETYFCEQTNEFDVGKEFKKGYDGKCSEVACRDEQCIKKEKDAVCPQIKEEKLQSPKLEEVNNYGSESANLNNTKEEGYRKRGRNWHGDNPEKLLHRYAY